MKNILYKIIKEQDKGLLNEKGVYQIRNKENNKVYIGSTAQKFSRRLSNHIKLLIHNKHHSRHLQHSFNITKDFEKFEISILEVCETNMCLQSEQKWINYYKSYNDEFGYNISPTAGSCLGIKKSLDEKIKVFERSRTLSDEQIISIFEYRNIQRLSNRKISELIGISKNQVASILTRENKYRYVKEKYNLKLEVKREKKFTKEDVSLIYDLYENQKLNVSEITKITGFEKVALNHLIHNKDIYKLERNGLVFNVEKNRKNKLFKRARKKGIKMNIIMLGIEVIFEAFELKHVSKLADEEIYKKLNITKKQLDSILACRYNRRKYNNIYLELKDKYDLRERRNILSEQDIIDLFNDYNSGEYLIEDLNLKYGYHDVGRLISNNKKLSKYYTEIIQRNELKIDKSLTKNSNLKSKYITERNKKNAKNYKLTDPNGLEYFIKNLAEFCRGKDLDAANFSRVSKNGKKYKGWKCESLD